MTGRQKRDPQRHRLSHADRAKAIERIDTALREDRLDLIEYDERVRAVENATTPEALAAQLADLPDRPGIRDWSPKLRVRARDRAHAVVWLADAFTEGALSSEEHERRLASANAAVTYKTLRQALDGVAGPSYATRERLLVTAGDRRAMAARLDRALADGLLGVEDHAAIETSLDAARRYGELDEISAKLDRLAELDLRDRAVRQLDDALGNGRLDPAEHQRRVDSVRAAGRNDDIAPVLADLGEPPDRALGWVLDRQDIADRRITDDTRKQASLVIEGALGDGLLSLQEYDERSRLVFRAKTGAELRPLLADLIRTGPPGATRPARPARIEAPGLPPRPDPAALQNRVGRPTLPGRLDSAGGQDSDGRTGVLDERDGAGRAGKTGQRDGAGPAGKTGQRPAGSEGLVKRPRRRYRLRTVVALGVVGAVVCGWLVHERGWPWQDPRLKEAWSAPAERTDGDAIGNWFTGSALVRARTDRLVSYAVENGQQQWIFQPPDRQQVCTLSRDTGEGIGLVGYGSEKDDTGCATVAAIDLNTGEVLWRHERDLSGDAFSQEDPVSDEIGIAAGVAVFRETGAFVALGLHGDGERWRATTPEGCWPYSVTGQGDDLVLITGCKDRSWRLSLVDTRSGQPRWNADAGRGPEPGVGLEKPLVVLSLRPLAVRLLDDDEEQPGSIVSFDDQGHRRGTIPLAQGDIELATVDFTDSGLGHEPFPARPLRLLTVIGDTLVVPQRKPRQSSQDEIAAYSLADGRRLWRTKLDGDVAAVGAGDGRLFVVIEELIADEVFTIRTLSERTGKVTASQPVYATHITEFTDHEFARAGGRYLVSSANGSRTDRPAALIRPSP